MAASLRPLEQVHRSLASEREAREAAYKEKALIQIELEAKQRLAFAMREVRKRGCGLAGLALERQRACVVLAACGSGCLLLLAEGPALPHAALCALAAVVPARRRRQPQARRWRRPGAAAATSGRCSACWMRWVLGAGGVKETSCFEARGFLCV